MGTAVWVHIGILIALSLSNIFVKDPEIQKIHQALMLLPDPETHKPFNAYLF